MAKKKLVLNARAEEKRHSCAKQRGRGVCPVWGEAKTCRGKTMKIV